MIDFAKAFNALTGHPPFAWQKRLYKEFVDARFESLTAIQLPTGVGKTMILAIWLLALAADPRRIPRRLIYVVNRRTVVDQSTDVAEQMRTRLLEAVEDPNHPLHEVAQSLRGLSAFKDHESPLAISTLRGEFADNAAWRLDPARPAIVVGTVDMIGSRLLFQGYGCGAKSKPLHAGFLGQDALLVHDEAHLEPAFQELIETIEGEQGRPGDFRKLHVVQLSATTRGDGKTRHEGEPRADSRVFRLEDRDTQGQDAVARRYRASKQIVLHALPDEKKLAEELVRLALEHRESGQAILVYARTVEVVQKVRVALDKEGLHVLPLTGTQRGHERDGLVQHGVFKRFVPDKEQDSDLQNKTVYLVSTSAGEVGVDLSADDLVCDLSTFESMAQRFGRVNRFGERDDTRIDIAHPTNLPDERAVNAEYEKDDPKGEVLVDGARRKTLDLLAELDGDGSPAALEALPADERAKAFSPEPKFLPATSILFDAWALTSIAGPFGGRPAVADYLHGEAPWERPETSVAWREEVDAFECADTSGDNAHGVPDKEIEGLLEDYPLKPQELLKDQTPRVMRELERMAERLAKEDRDGISVWAIHADGKFARHKLSELAIKDKQGRFLVDLAQATIVLPPSAGGLKDGLLDGSSAEVVTDVADEWYVVPRQAATERRSNSADAENGRVKRRTRAWDEAGPPPGMRLVRRVDIRPGSEDNESEDLDAGQPFRRYREFYVRPRSADDDGSKASLAEVEVDVHLTETESIAASIAQALGLDAELMAALTFAARCHDLGKRRLIWQRSVGNYESGKWVAKSNEPMKIRDLNGYRHEYGSLLDATVAPDFQEQSDDVRELALHLIAAHHGRGRPHFTADEAFDPEPRGRDSLAPARESPRRFARLQRKYGRWGLAYLESLLRAADYKASSSKGGAT